MNTANYNITDDRLKISFDERLPEDKYKEIKSLGFTYWHGSKLFVALWAYNATVPTSWKSTPLDTIES